MPAIHDVLFRLLGDESGARDALDQVAAELAAFARIHAEADAEINTTEATLRLNELKAKLLDLDASTTSPKIQTDIAGVLGQITVLKEQLAELDREDVTIDVDVRRGIFERLAALTAQTNLLTKASGLADESTKSFAARIADTAVSFGPFTTQLKTFIPLMIALAGVIDAVVAALAALVISLSAAVAAVGALGVAFGGVVLPAIATVIGAIKQFKDESGKAGTAAHALKTTFEAFGDLAKKIDFSPIFRVLTFGLARLQAVLRIIGPSFDLFIHAFAGGLRDFVRILTGPAMAQGLSQLVGLAAGVLQPAAQAAGFLFRALNNIAVAAMPFLVAGFKGLAGVTKAFANSTRNIDRTRGIIGELVRNLAVWIDLATQVGRIMLGIFTAAEPSAREFVQFLADGARNIADFIQSAEGQEKIKQFFEDTLPLAQSLVSVIAGVVLAFVQLGQLAAPILKPFADALGFVFSVLNKLLAAANKLNLGPIFGALLSPVQILLGPVGTLVRTVQLLIRLFPHLGGVVHAVLGVADDAAQGVASAFRSVLHFVGEVWGRVKNIVGDAISFVFKIPGVALYVNLATKIWKAVFGVIVEAIKFEIGFVSGIVQKARDIFEKVKNIMAEGVDLVVDVILNLPGSGGGPGPFGDFTQFLQGHIPLGQHGLRNFMGGMAVVGEAGPELVRLPRGADVIPNPESRRIAQTFNVHGVFGTGPSDAREIAARLGLIYRQRGGNL